VSSRAARMGVLPAAWHRIGHGVEIYSLSCARAARDEPPDKRPNHVFAGRSARGDVLPRNSSKPTADQAGTAYGTFVCGCAIRLVPFQQRRKLQLAIRCAVDDWRQFLWSSVAGAEASAGVVDHAHGGGCDLVAVV